MASNLQDFTLTDRQADGQMDGCLTYQPHPLSLTKSSGLNPSALLKDRLKGD